MSSTSDTLVRPGTAHFDLWGGVATVLVTDERALDDVLALVHRTVAEVDKAASAYRTDSDVSRLNAAAGRPVVVSRVLREAVDVALRAAQATDGLVDPTVGAGTLARAGAQVTGGGRVERGGWRAVQVDPHLGTVQLPAHLRLDLGATAKAWAADRCATRAAEAVLEYDAGVLVSLSGDLAVAGTVPPEGFLVRVTDDHRTDPADLSVPGVTVGVHQGGLATSSVSVRSTTASDGTAQAHIVDPVTTRPVQPYWRTVTVAAASCTDANAASTAAIVRGRDADTWLAGLGLPARLVRLDGTVVTVAGWPDEDGA